MSTEKKSGVIYILTNPSFPDYVKIGYATNIEKRLAQLNRSECMPFAFRAAARSSKLSAILILEELMAKRFDNNKNDKK